MGTIFSKSVSTVKKTPAQGQVTATLKKFNIIIPKAKKKRGKMTMLWQKVWRMEALKVVRGDHFCTHTS